MPGDIKVQLSYVVPDTTRHAVFMRAPTDKETPGHSGKRVTLETTIYDGRNVGLKLDDAAFELVRHPTALATEDFYGDPERVRERYYGEMRELFAKVTGCAHVLIFHHQVRNKDRLVSGVSKEGVSTNTPVQPYAYGIHSDSSCFHAEETFRNMVQRMPKECRRGRFLYINAWRNISEDPIEDDHLAVLDERTLVKPDDYIQTDLHGVGYDVLQYNLSCRNVRQHKWYYFPRMAKDEVLVFKQWDSDPLRDGRLCFHTAIHDPTAPAGAPARQSIEARGFLFFPDHTPNTCPPIPACGAADGEEEDDKALSGAQSLQGGLTYIEGSGSIRAQVVSSLRSQYVGGGAKRVLEVLAEDEGRHHGLTDASPATKRRAVELLLQRGASEQVDRIFAEPPVAGFLAAKM